MFEKVFCENFKRHTEALFRRKNIAFTVLVNFLKSPPSTSNHLYSSVFSIWGKRFQKTLTCMILKNTGGIKVYENGKEALYKQKKVVFVIFFNTRFFFTGKPLLCLASFKYILIFTGKTFSKLKLFLCLCSTYFTFGMTSRNCRIIDLSMTWLA